MNEPENLTLQILREIRGEIGRLDQKVDNPGARLRSGIADVGSEIKSLRADVAYDLMTLEKRLGEQFSGLRRSVMEYHSPTIGHGIALHNKRP